MKNCTTSPSSPSLGCRNKARWRRKTGLCVFVLAVLGSVGIIATMVTQNSLAQQRDSAIPVKATASTPRLPANDPAFDYATGLSKAFRHATDRVLPSVVTIQRTSTIGLQANTAPGDRDENGRGREELPFDDMFRDPLLRRFFGDIPNMPSIPFPDVPHSPELSMGSGVIINSDGVILTNNHVVAGGGKIMVRLHDGRELEATKVITDPRTDLAVVRIKDAGNLPAAQMGDSDALNVGDWVIAVGNPFGLEETVTAGIISAKGRGIGITAREEFLQTDAAINPGNSGGPLVNLHGEVVGINTAISSRTGGYQGVGFAIPVNLAKWVSSQLVEHGSVTRAFLGIGIQELTPELASHLGMQGTPGTMVTEIRPDSPAAEAGVKTGDVVIEFGGHAIHNPREIQAVVEQASIGSKQPLVIIRDGKRMTLNVTMRQQPKDYGLADYESPDLGARQGEVAEDLGIEVSNLTPEMAAQLHLKNVAGVVITAVRNGSPADLAGLRTSMIIERIGQKPISNLDEFRTAMKDQSLTKGVLMLVRSQEGSRFVIIRSSQ